MKRLIVALFLSLSLGLAVQQDVKADYYVAYPDGSEADVWAYSGGRLAFIFWDWAGDWDVFTTHSYSYGSPTLLNLGVGSVFGYALNYLYTGAVTGRLYYDAYGDVGLGWFYIGLVYI